MANITEILGTDSLSSSRITINGNFSSLNDELADVTSILDPVNSTISGVSSIAGEQITIQSNNSIIVEATSSALLVGVAAQFDSTLTVGGSLSKTGVNGTVAAPLSAGNTTLQPANSAYTSYILSANGNVQAGNQGQEITIINANAGPITISGDLGATSLTLNDNNSTVTLRYIGAKWYVISSAGATILFN